MRGDLSRLSFDPGRDYSAVLMQQGRVMLDADVNELVELIDQRLRLDKIDVMGRHAVPAETPDGFLIDLTDDGRLTIGPGRIYVDGILAENHGAGRLEFDVSLEEQRGTAPVAYENQPYLPGAAELAPAPTDGGPFLVYLDVWRRGVTAAEDPGLIEKALGVANATRVQTVWQVKIYPARRSGRSLDADVSCVTPEADVPGWVEFAAPSPGRLTTIGQSAPLMGDRWVIPPDGGYSGAENHLYRVEIHDGGPAGQATFKWSRSNGSAAASVTAIDPAGSVVTVSEASGAERWPFAADDWVELTDERHELYARPGVMRTVRNVDEVARTVTLTQPLPAGEFDSIDRARGTRLRRWDRRGAGGSDGKASDQDGKGVMTVPEAETAVELENGIEIAFSTDPTSGSFRPGDHWIFAARTVDRSVERLEKAPPRGIHHHYCRLAVVTFPNGPVEDCRVLWPPDGRRPPR